MDEEIDPGRADIVSATIFISHSSKDQAIAVTLCNALENRGLTCWIASRDVAPGENFQEAIVRAIRNAKVMVLVFTENANNSDEIKKELALASRYKLVVIPARAEDVLPSDAFELELSTRQWINLFDNWERGIEGLISRIVSIAGVKSGRETETTAPPVAQKPTGITSAPFSVPTPRDHAAIKSRPLRSRTAMAVLSFAFVGLGLAFALWAFALDRQPQRPSMPIEVVYRPPTDPKLAPTMDWLRKRAYLEDLREFLAPLKLPRKLTFAAQQCGLVNAYYSVANSTIVICYELIDWIESIAKPSENVTREDVKLGAITQVALHEFSHALTDMLRIPILGNEEDAADQLAAVIMLEFNADLARRTLPAVMALRRFEMETQKATPEDLSSAHGTTTQRFYNHLCLLYGADPKVFGHLVEERLLPSSRAVTCQTLYRQMKHAFDAFIRPHVDQAVLKKPKVRPWIN